ncbi:unnamed protein product [Candidula unifasciata]|uniref:Uncharacterized protein n=1 Tax=Candidula unifasciata TaxID=100452 RepID=A0A8S3YYQ9_9EUPU|nr:unnamed protein product [Candidula unifasciata]
MALSVEKLLVDAHTLVLHLKDHDLLAENIIAVTQTLYNKTKAMKQYQDDITELNEIAKHRPRSTLVLGLAQENRQIRDLQQENRELQAALEEHQSALELIMQKYREHTVKLLHSNRVEKSLQEREVVDKESVCQLMDKIDEMAGVMQKAIEVDEKLGRVDEERLTRLEVENKALRELLEICSTSKERIVSVEPMKDRGNESESEDDKTDTDCDSSILVSPVKVNEEEMTDEDRTNSRQDELDSQDDLSATSADSEDTITLGNARLPGASKSANDVRKSKPAASAEGDNVKKTKSSTLLKKDTAAGKKTASTEVKKDSKGKKILPKTAGKK